MQPSVTVVCGHCICTCVYNACQERFHSGQIVWSYVWSCYNHCTVDRTTTKLVHNMLVLPIFTSTKCISYCGGCVRIAIPTNLSSGCRERDAPSTFCHQLPLINITSTIFSIQMDNILMILLCIVSCAVQSVFSCSCYKENSLSDCKDTKTIFNDCALCSSNNYKQLVYHKRFLLGYGRIIWFFGGNASLPIKNRCGYSM